MQGCVVCSKTAGDLSSSKPLRKVFMGGLMVCHFQTVLMYLVEVHTTPLLSPGHSSCCRRMQERRG